MLYFERSQGFLQTAILDVYCLNMFIHIIQFVRYHGFYLKVLGFNRVVQCIFHIKIKKSSEITYLGLIIYMPKT